MTDKNRITLRSEQTDGLEIEITVEGNFTDESLAQAALAGFTAADAVPLCPDLSDLRVPAPASYGTTGAANTGHEVRVNPRGPEDVQPRVRISPNGRREDQPLLTGRDPEDALTYDATLMLPSTTPPRTAR